jgi:hypothetical protein
MASRVAVAVDVPLTGNGNITCSFVGWYIAADGEVEGMTDLEDESAFGFRIAAMLLPILPGESVGEEPLPSSCWNFCGEVVRELSFVFCSDFFIYSPVMFRKCVGTTAPTMSGTIAEDA